MKEKHQPAQFGCIKLGLQVGLGFGFNHVWIEVYYRKIEIFLNPIVLD